MAYESINPFTEEVVQSFDTISNYELEVKLREVEKVTEQWMKTDMETRIKLLQNTAKLLRQDIDKHSGRITSEMGKPITQSRAEVEKCAWVCDYYAENAASFLAPKQMKSTAKKSYVHFEPTGIILAVMPWNFPYWQVFRFLAPNLVAGNTGLLKHSSNVPLCASAIELLLIEAGAPSGIFRNLMIDYDQVDHIIDHPAVTGVTVTGSSYAGYSIAEKAGQAGKKTVLELGGSDPYIVFDDADIDRAVETGIMARFQSNGQSCIAAKRFIIQETVYNKFLDKFTDAVRQLKTGDPMDPETVIGPLARKDLLLQLLDQLSQLEEHGGKIICGGNRNEDNMMILEPAIVTGLAADDPVNKQELFGPVIPFFHFKTEKEAVRMANNTPFGLGASVWTGDEEKAARVATEIHTGTVAVNGMVKSEPGLPFGGIKGSGYGRELSEFGLHEFLNIKTVSYF